MPKRKVSRPPAAKGETMKRLATLFVSICLLAGVAFTQQTAVPTPAVANSFADGTFYAPNFGRWSLQVYGSIAASGTSLQAAYPVATTPDGIQFVPFNAKAKINIGTGSTAEIATISSVSNCTLAAYSAGSICTITLSSGVTNAHSAGEPITSADNGIMEAVSYAQQTGGGQVYFLVDCGVITLSTSGLTTTSTCFVPNVFYNQGAAGRVTTTITTSANWAVGISNATSAFCTANSTLTAGTTCIANQGAYALSAVSSPTANDITAVLITAGTSNAGAGKVHVKVWGYAPAQPAY